MQGHIHLAKFFQAHSFINRFEKNYECQYNEDANF